jgi:hypothetical protein
MLVASSAVLLLLLLLLHMTTRLADDHVTQNVSLSSVLFGECTINASLCVS